MITTGTYINLSRAYEVALLGGYSISIGIHPEWAKLVNDYDLIKSFYQGVEFRKKGDIYVDISNPYLNQYTRQESIKDIISRVETARGHNKPTEYGENSGADQLLKRAAEKLRLSIKDIQNIRKISETIAQLDHSQYIGAEHVAEAIQYCSKISERDGAIDPESHEKCFGFGIKISLFDIDAYDINNAIEYLQSRK